MGLRLGDSRGGGGESAELRDQGHFCSKISKSVPKFTLRPSLPHLSHRRPLPGHKIRAGSWKLGAGIPGRTGRAEAGRGGRVSHWLPAGQPGAQEALAGTRGTTRRPGRWSWVEGPRVGSFNHSWQLFLGPRQAGLEALGSRHLPESRRPWGVGGAMHKVWQVWMWPWGRGMCVRRHKLQIEVERKQ